MKKILLLSALALSTVPTFAKYEPWNYTFIEAHITKSTTSATTYGSAERDVFLEFQGSTRYNLLDLYWFIDRSNIFNDSDLSSKYGVDPNYVYAEINPRISIDGLTGKDLSIGPVNEWFISGLFDYDSASENGLGIKRYYIGIGNYINVPGFDYFKTNIYARWIDENYYRTENDWNGFMFNSSYGATLYKFDNGMKFTFGGWMDYVFGATIENAGHSSTSFQWDNQIRFYFTDNISVSYSHKINHNFGEFIKSSANDVNSHSNSIGIHYGITF